MDVVCPPGRGWRIMHAGYWLTLVLVLVSCGGGSSNNNNPPPATTSETDTPSEAEPLGDITLSGRLEYQFVPVHDSCELGLDYSSTQLRPIRGATVQLIDAASGGLIDSEVSSETGEYSFELNRERQVFVRVRAELKQADSPGWDVEVRDNTSNTQSALANRPLYVLDSAPVDVEIGGQSLNLIAATGWDGSRYAQARAAAPFAILDAIYTGMSLVLSADPDALFPPLDVFWSVNNATTTGNVANGAIGTSYYQPDIDSLFLLGKANDDTEEFDDHVILHEWGHYFEDNFSRTDSTGGPHNLSNRLDMRLAFGEGWATALSGMALDDPLYCDTAGIDQSNGFKIDIENDVFGTRGWFNETSVASMMYDLWDSGTRDDDGGSLGFTPIYDIFVDKQLNTSAFTSVFSFMTELKADNPDEQVFVGQLMLEHNISGSDIYGSGEINDSQDFASPEDVLPVYTEIVADGIPIQICSNKQFDPSRDGNKLSVHRYLKLSLAAPGGYRIEVATVNPDSSPPEGFDCTSADSNDPELRKHSDPDFYLVRRGQRVLEGDSCEANSEIASGSLSAGDYVIDLLEFRYADKLTPSEYPGRTCFDISVQAL